MTLLALPESPKPPEPPLLTYLETSRKPVYGKRVECKSLNLRVGPERYEWLLTEIPGQTRWCDVDQTGGGIKSAIELTINDEIVRSFRGRPRIARLAKLSLLENASKARCAASWIATGLSRLQASALASDPSVGGLTGDYEAPPGAVRLIIGEMGSGKSLILERIHQKSIQLSRENPNAPIPTYLKAGSIEGSLQNALLSECEGFSDPRTRGVNLVIDR